MATAVTDALTVDAAMTEKALLDTAIIEPATAPVVNPAAAESMTSRLRKPLVLFILTIFAVFLGPQFISGIAPAVTSVASASPLWLALALLLAVGSMLAFAVLRRSLLRSTGNVITMFASTSIAYTAGAMHLTMPAGAVVAMTHTFRRLRELRVTPGAATWSLAVAGILSTTVLTALGLFGVAAATGSSTAITTLWGVAGAVAVAGALRWYSQHPATVDRIALRWIIRWNRILHRADDTGLATVRNGLADLRAVRVTGAGWVSATAAAVLNWVFDMLCLAACAAAVGTPINPLLLVVGYVAAMTSGLSPMPGGIGVVDGALVLTLTAAGAAAPLALAAVLLYRVVAHGHVMLFGWTAIAVRYTPRPAPRARRAR